MADNFFDAEDIVEQPTQEDNFFDEADVVSQEAPVSEPVEEDISKTESVARGAGQGVTLGSSDELGSFAYTAFDKLRGLLGGDSQLEVAQQLEEQGFKGDIGPTSFGEAYEETRDELRADNEAAQEANPGSYLAGEAAGAMALPLGKVKAIQNLNKATKASKLGQLAGKVPGVGKALQSGVSMAPQAMLEGAAYGAGQAEELSDIPEEMLEAGSLSGAVTALAPAAVEGGLKLAGKAGMGALKGGIKLSSKMNPREVDDFFSDPMKYISNIKRKDSVKVLEGQIDDLANSARDFSNKAREHLSDEASYKVSDIAGIFKRKALEAQKKESTKQAFKSLMGFADNIERTYKGSMSQKQIQNILDDLNSTAYNGLKKDAPGAVTDQLKHAGGELSDVLKKSNPEYKNTMLESSKRMKTLSDVADEFKIKDDVIKNYNEFGDFVDVTKKVKLKKGDAVGNKLKTLLDEDKGDISDLLNRPDVKEYLKADPDVLRDVLRSREFKKALEDSQYNIRAMTTVKSVLQAAGLVGISNPLVGATIATAAAAPFASKAILKRPEMVKKVKDVGEAVIGSIDNLDKGLGRFIPSAIGFTSAKVNESDKNKERMTRLEASTPEQLNQMAQMFRGQGKAGEEFSRVLEKASADEDRKDVLLFGLQQQPAFRELLKRIEDEK